MLCVPVPDLWVLPCVRRSAAGRGVSARGARGRKSLQRSQPMAARLSPEGRGGRLLGVGRSGRRAARRQQQTGRSSLGEEGERGKAREATGPCFAAPEEKHRGRKPTCLPALWPWSPTVPARSSLRSRCWSLIWIRRLPSRWVAWQASRGLGTFFVRCQESCQGISLSLSPPAWSLFPGAYQGLAPRNLPPPPNIPTYLSLKQPSGSGHCVLMILSGFAWKYVPPPHPSPPTPPPIPPYPPSPPPPLISLGLTSK